MDHLDGEAFAGPWYDGNEELGQSTEVSKMTLAQIQEAVEELPREELSRFRNWFQERDAQAWDRQIAEDAESGKLDFLAEEALSEYRDGQTREL